MLAFLPAARPGGATLGSAPSNSAVPAPGCPPSARVPSFNPPSPRASSGGGALARLPSGVGEGEGEGEGEAG